MPILGTPIGSPSAADILDSGRVDIVTLQFSKQYDDLFKQRVRAGRLRQAVTATVQLDLLTLGGTPIDLTAYGIENGQQFPAGDFGNWTGSSSSSSFSSETSPPGGLAARIREAAEVIRDSIPADISVSDAANGIVRVE